MTKREIFLRQLFSLRGIWLLPTIAIFAVFLTHAWNDSITAAHLAKEGATTTAKVTGLGRSNDLSSKNNDRNRNVRFSFIVNGTTYDGWQRVGIDLYRSLEIGASLPVRYWVKDARLNEIEPGTHASLALFGKIGTAIIAGIILLLVFHCWRRASLASWMAQNGVPKEVQVIRLVRGRKQFFTTGYYHVIAWKNDDGSKGGSRFHLKEELPEVGDMTTILTDPSGRRTSIWQRDL